MSLKTQKSMYGQIPDMLRNSTDPQCFVELVRFNIRDRTLKYCALGTIYHQSGEGYFKANFSGHKKLLFSLSNVTKETKPKFMACPECNARCRFWYLLAHLNDVHEFPFAKTADMLERAKPYDQSNSKWQKFKDYLKA